MLDVNDKIKIQSTGEFTLSNGAGNTDYGIRSKGPGAFVDWYPFAKFADTKGSIIRTSSKFQQSFNPMSGAGVQSLITTDLGEKCTHYLLAGTVCVNLEEDQTQFSKSPRMFLELFIGGQGVGGYQAVVFSRDTEYVSYEGLQMSVSFTGIKKFNSAANRVAEMRLKSLEGPHARVMPIDGNLALFGFTYPEDYR